jgi:hypothetical protein
MTPVTASLQLLLAGKPRFSHFWYTALSEICALGCWVRFEPTRRSWFGTRQHLNAPPEFARSLLSHGDMDLTAAERGFLVAPVARRCASIKVRNFLELCTAPNLVKYPFQFSLKIIQIQYYPT